MKTIKNITKIDEIRQEMILLFSTVCEKNKDKMTLAMCEGCQKQLESYMRMIELKFHQALSSQAQEIMEGDFQSVGKGKWQVRCFACKGQGNKIANK